MEVIFRSFLGGCFFCVGGSVLFLIVFYGDLIKDRCSVFFVGLCVTVRGDLSSWVLECLEVVLICSSFES